MRHEIGSNFFLYTNAHAHIIKLTQTASSSDGFCKSRLTKIGTTDRGLDKKYQGLKIYEYIKALWIKCYALELLYGRQDAKCFFPNC